MRIVVITAIAIGVAEGIVRSKDSNLLAANGEHIALTKSLTKHLPEHMGFVKRRPKLTLTILRL